MFFFRHVFMFSIGFGKDAFPSIISKVAAEGLTNRILMRGQEIKVPDGLQGPSMFINQEQTEQGFAILGRSLQYTRSRYPNVPIVLMHIPSAATMYKFTSEKIDLWDMASQDPINTQKPAADIRPRSNDFCRRAMAIANAEGVFFYDARAAMADAAQNELLHGPVDWHHPNLRGYQVLAGEVGQALLALKRGVREDFKPCVELY
jgi:hypothetical protein